MSETSRRQEFPYSLLMGCFANPSIATAGDGYSYGLRLEIPNDLIEVKNLWARFRFKFHTDIAASYRQVQKVTVSDGADISTAPFVRTVVLDRAEDVNHYVDISIDLTGFHNPTGQNYVTFHLLKDPGHSTTNKGVLELLKLDSLITTRGVR